MLTVEQILAADDIEPVTVAVPEWGGDVQVRPLSSEQIEQMERWWDENPAGRGYRVKLLSLAIVGCDFTPDQLRQLNAKHGGVIRRLADKILEISQPDYEAIAGNSDAGETAGNGSG